MYNELHAKFNETAEELNKVKVSEVKLTAKVYALSQRVNNQMILESADKIMVRLYTDLSSF